jgi:hypothetical protein
VKAAIDAVRRELQNQEAHLARAMKDPKQGYKISAIQHDLRELQVGLEVLRREYK